MKYKGKTITKHYRGNYYARYYVNHKQYSVYGATKIECYNKLKVAFNSKAIPKNKDNRIKLIDWLNNWLDKYKKPKLKPSTLYQYECCINRIAKKPFAKCYIDNLTSDDLQTFFNTIKAPRQRKHFYNVLNSALNKAYVSRLIDFNPCRAVELPYYESAESKAFNYEQEQKFLIESKKSDCYLFFLFMLLFGCRPGELFALNREDISNDYITISKTLDQLNNIVAPKTRNGIRQVPIFEDCNKLIELLKSKKGRLFNFSSRKANEHFNNICKKLGYKGFTLYSLRHTFVTRKYEEGIPIEIISKWVGHSNIKITSKYYLHINADYERKVISNLKDKRKL